MRSSTETLVAAMRILARDIQSADGVANAAISEAADRLAELQARVAEIENSLSGAADHQRQREILGAARKKCGYTIQFLMLSGECGALIAAINRFLAQGKGTPADLVDEIAGVHLLLQQANQLLGEDAVAERVNHKLQRLAEQLGMAGEAA